MLIKRRLFNALVEHQHAEEVSYCLVPRRLDHQHPWEWPGSYALIVSKWVILMEHEIPIPVTAKRAAELLHAMRTLRDERLRCVVRAIGGGAS